MVNYCSCLTYRHNQGKFIRTRLILQVSWLSLIKMGVIRERKLCFNKNSNILLWILDPSAVHCILSFFVCLFYMIINFRGIASAAHA